MGIATETRLGQDLREGDVVVDGHRTIRTRTELGYGPTTLDRIEVLFTDGSVVRYAQRESVTVVIPEPNWDDALYELSRLAYQYCECGHCTCKSLDGSIVAALKYLIGRETARQSTEENATDELFQESN